jgi:Protein of unknown function (DUF1579)
MKEARIMGMPKPTAGHEKLGRLEGVWEGRETMHPSHWDPKGGVAVGRMTGRVALGGFALIGDYEQERDGVKTFAGHSVFTFDARQGLYSLHWFDCVGSVPEVFTGSFQGDTLVVAHGGPAIHAQLTYELHGPRSLRSKMEMSPDGSVWSTLFEGGYERRD